MLLMRVGQLQELLLCSETASGERLGRVMREAILHEDNLVQVVFEEVCAVVASVAIVDSEVAALGPLLAGDLAGRLCHVKDDAHTVFIVIPLDALVGVGRVTGDNAVRL